MVCYDLLLFGLKIEITTWGTNYMPFLIFRRDHLRSTSGIICGSGSFAVKFGDHFRSGDHLRSGIICGAVQYSIAINFAYLQDWTQLQILQILRFFVLGSNLTNFCDFSLNSIRYTKIRCLNDFSVRCAEIYNFMLIDQQAPACRFYKIYIFTLTSRFFN